VYQPKLLGIATDDDDRPETEASPERQLLIAVLVQALRDLRDPHSPHARPAREFLLGPHGAEVCELLDWDAGRLRQFVLRYHAAP
jgi:hypothetical protein